MLTEEPQPEYSHGELAKPVASNSIHSFVALSMLVLASAEATVGNTASNK